MTTDFKVSTESPQFFWAVIAIVAAVSIPMRLGGATPDVSWLIDMCERMLNGEAAYIDIFETTPPIPTLLYMPGAIVSSLTGLSTEAVVYAYSYGTCFLCFWLTLRILPDEIPGVGPTRWALVFPSALFLFVLSTDAFAQREFFSAALTLPMIAIFIRRLIDNEWAPYPLRFWAAITCGLSVAIKPPLLALPVITIAAYYLLVRREIRFIYSSGLIAAAIISVVLTAASLAAFPAYFDGVTTLMRDVYVPWRYNHPLAALQPVMIAIIICFIIVTAMSFQSNRRDSALLLLAAAFGYVLVYFGQGKYYAYHVLPGAMFAFMAVWTLLWPRLESGLDERNSNPKLLIVTGAAAVILIQQFFTAFDDGRPEMKDLDWAQSLDRPTAMAITPSIAFSFPLARKIDAQWVDRIHSQWVSHYAKTADKVIDLTDEDRERYMAYQDFDLNRVKTLIVEKQPDLVIQCISKKHLWISESLLEREPALFDNYEVIAEEGIFRVWKRRDYAANSENTKLSKRIQ